MRARALQALGAGARAARSSGLGPVVRAAVGGVDGALRALDRPPLSADVEGVRVHGYLRHRSFLAEASKPRTTYAQLFLRLLRPGMTVVDGGAHVGLYTLLAARGVGPDGRVFAFEPDRYNLAALERSLRSVAAENVTLLPKALADRRGTATFYETRSTIGSSLIARDDGAARTVETTTVDAELAGREIRDLLVKLNVEGAELATLAGMRETLARATGDVHVFAEINPPLLEDPRAVVRALEAEGLQVSLVDLATQQPVPLPEPLPKGHLLAHRPQTPA